jgi:hypothetical protein
MVQDGVFPLFKGSYKVRGPGRHFLPFLLGRAAFMGLKVGYNLVTIVIIDVPASVGRPKTFDPSIATYVALKGAPSPKVLEAAWAERASFH